MNIHKYYIEHQPNNTIKIYRTPQSGTEKIFLDRYSCSSKWVGMLEYEVVYTSLQLENIYSKLMNYFN